jgi:hypothetical protein
MQSRAFVRLFHVFFFFMLFRGAFFRFLCPFALFLPEYRHDKARLGCL